MKTLVISLVSAILTSTSPAPLSAQDDRTPVTIAGTSLPDFFHPTRKGAYNALFDQIMDGIDAEVPYRLDFLPVRRASRAFSNRDKDCFFIANRRNYDGIDHYVTTDTIHISSKKLYTKETAALIESRDSLNGLTLAADAGTGTTHILPRILPASSRLIATESIEKSLQLLTAGRVDAVIAYELDMAAYLQATGEKPAVHTSSDFNLQESESAVACWATPKTATFVDAVNARIRSLKGSGALIDPVAHVNK